MLGTPIPLQGASDLRFTMLTVAVAQLGELLRIPLTAQDRLENRQPGDTGDIADHVLEFEVHLGERLLHVLDMLPSICYQHSPLAQVTAQHTDLLGWTKGGG